MGLADLVPGVSGGTMAFIFGIYDKLISSIKTITSETMRFAFMFKIRKAWGTFPASFLLPLALGMLVAIFVFANAVSYLLDTQALLIWSFFFGLIIGSVYLVKKRVIHWSYGRYLSLLSGALLTFFLAGLTAPQQFDSNLYLFFAGAIAFCAMILPGISGSLILILLGAYETVLQAASDRNLIPLLFLAVGGFVGLGLFSRLLSWLLRHYHDIVVTFLIGLMIGSLRKIWPFRSESSSSSEALTNYTQQNILPESITQLFIALVFAASAFIIIVKLEKAANLSQTKTLK